MGKRGRGDEVEKRNWVEGAAEIKGIELKRCGIGRVSKRLMNVWDTEVNTATPYSPNSKIKTTSTWKA